jgi:hypothetical protein
MCGIIKGKVTSDLYDISKVPSDEYVYELYSRDSSITEERIYSLIAVLHEKKDMLYDFALGKNLAAETGKVENIEKSC